MNFAGLMLLSTAAVVSAVTRISLWPFSPSPEFLHLGFANETDGSVASLGAAKTSPFLLYGEVSIGTPLKHFKLLLDTSSSLSYVPSLEYYSGPDSGFLKIAEKKPKNAFAPCKSATVEKYETFVVVPKQEGTYFVQDVVCFEKLCAKNQPLKITANLDLDVLRSPADGLLGLAFRTASPLYTVPAAQHVLRYNKPLLSMFTIWTNYDHSLTPAGYLTLGEFDYKHCANECSWFNVTRLQYWEISIDRVEIGTTIVNAKYPLRTVFNTRQHFIAAKPSLAAQIANILHAVRTKDGRYKVDCSAIYKSDRMNFVDQGQRFSIPGSLYIYKDATDQNCYLLLKDTPMVKGVDLELGTVVLNEFCQVFHIEKKSLGLCYKQW